MAPPTPPAPAYRLKSLNTLAFPKGKLPRCEMTGMPATVECVTPHITLYFASKEYALDAWHGIMHKISPLLGPLRASSEAVGTEDDRARREYTAEMSKKALVDICSQESSKFLVAKKFELAVPGALQALIFLKDLYGDGAVETIAPLVQLAKANLGLQKYAEAEECLRRATRNVEKNPDCSNNARSLIHRNFGLLYFAQNKLDKAIAELSHDVYCSSLETGPEHVETSVGYFHLGSVFYAQHKIENALAFYDKFVDVWHKFLVKAATSPEESSGRLGSDDTRFRETAEMLARVLDVRVKLLGENHIACAEAKYTIGLLLYATDNDEEEGKEECGRRDEARSKIQEALDAYTKHLGPDHPSTLVVKNVFETMPPPKMASTADRITGFGALREEEEGDADNFAAFSSHFPSEMARAAPQSPIPLVPASVAGGL